MMSSCARCGPAIVSIMCLLSSLGCRTNRDNGETPMTKESIYFNQLLKCNGTTLPSAEFTIAPEQKMSFDLVFQSKLEEPEVACVVYLKANDGKLVVTSGSAVATKSGDTYTLHCELDAPPKERPDSEVEVRDSKGNVIACGPLPVKS